MDAETTALLEVTRKHTRAASRQLRTLGALYAQLADRLDEVAASTAKPEEAQRNDEHHEQDA